MSFSDLSSFPHKPPLRIAIVDAGSGVSMTLAGLAQPLQLAAAIGRRQQVDAVVVDVRHLPGGSASQSDAHIVLLAADAGQPEPEAAQLKVLTDRCRNAALWGAVGAPVLWLARAGMLNGTRIALPWSLTPEAEGIAERAILTPQLFEFDKGRLTCCGGAASIDFALTLVQVFCGSDVQAQVMEALCIERVRDGSERQRIALHARFGALQPKLSEAVALMEANIEEPLSADDVASLVGVSRRQLERLFKQYLGSVPSRYYLELRLQRARQLLLESNHSIVQVGLMCGFSSASHFSTAYGAMFGMTPRDERQRKLQPST